MKVTGENEKQEVTAMVIRDFNLDDGQFKPAGQNLEAIRKELERIIAYLLTRDFERLLNAMYRLDVSEEKFRNVLNGAAGNDVSGNLAELVIERELKKIETRARFRQ